MDSTDLIIIILICIASFILGQKYSNNSSNNSSGKKKGKKFDYNEVRIILSFIKF